MRRTRVGAILMVAVWLVGCGGESRGGGSNGSGSPSAGGTGSETTGAAGPGTSSGDGSTDSGSGGSSDGGSGETTGPGTDSTSGGASSGGAGGTAATGGVDGGEGAGTTAGGGCESAEDCELFQDCCSCRAVEVGSLQPSCRLACDQPQCDAQGIGSGDVACLLGSCVINRSCDDRAVTCDVVTPECGAGSQAEVVDGCYTGNCRETAQCSQVRSCDVCAEAGLWCVTLSDFMSTFQCVAPRDGCDENDCECMGVCQSPFICATGGDSGLNCVCLVC